VGTFDHLAAGLEGGDIVVTLGRTFRAVYYKRAGFPRLILRQRTKSAHSGSATTKPLRSDLNVGRVLESLSDVAGLHH
jgi:hypothetical protein